ncbi:hypothetical protein [Streptomyces sp. NPDC002644]
MNLPAIPVAAAVELLDVLAITYHEDPDTIGQLLAAHGLAVSRHEATQYDVRATDHGRQVAAAELDRAREDLLAELPVDVTGPLTAAVRTQADTLTAAWHTQRTTNTAQENAA